MKLISRLLRKGRQSLSFPPEDKTEVTAHQDKIRAVRCSKSSHCDTVQAKRLVKKKNSTSKISPDIEASSQQTLETAESSWITSREGSMGTSSLRTIDTTGSTSSWNKKRVRFDSVNTRVCSRIVGDHPDTEIPLAIGWEFVDEPSIPVDEFELEKLTRKMNQRSEDLVDMCTLPTKQSELPQNRAHSSGLEMNKKTLRKAMAFAESSHTMKCSEVSSQSKDDLEPVSMEERVHLLKHVAGYTRSKINREERRRRMQIMMEWTYRKDPCDETQPCTISNFEVFFNRYLKRNERIPPPFHGIHHS